jgi:hypothetical protein
LPENASIAAYQSTPSMGKCNLPMGGPYSGNKSIDFNTAGENYLSQFSLASLLGFKVSKKRGRPKGSKDSYKQIRSY